LTREAKEKVQNGVEKGRDYKSLARFKEASRFKDKKVK